jgi:hypothetical protein
MSPVMVPVFKKVPSLEEFYEDFTNDEWLGTVTPNSFTMRIIRRRRHLNRVLPKGK